MVLFGHNRFICQIGSLLAKMVLFGKGGSAWAKGVLFEQNRSTCAKVVLFGQTCF